MKIGIIGTGKMGSAIFRLLATRPYQITVLAIDETEARVSQKECLKWLKRSLRRGKMSSSDFDKKRKTLNFTHQIEDLAAAEVLIEAIYEDHAVKLAFFDKLESVVAKDAVIVTNTSSLSIEDLARNLRHKNRFCGLHFFYPVMLINLIEIIRCAETPDFLVKQLQDLCKTVDRQSITVFDSPGSMINVILVHYYVEAFYILEEGLALPSKVDELARKFFYIGPCESLDVIGIDFFVGAIQHIMDWFFEGTGEENKTLSDIREGYTVPYLFDRLIAEQRHGKKVSKGIYLYNKNKPIDDVHEFYMNPACDLQSSTQPKTEDYITDRLLYAVFSGCLYSLEKELSTMEEIDLGIKEVLLMKEGPFTMMQAIGRRELKEKFDYLVQHASRRFQQNNLDFPSK